MAESTPTPSEDQSSVLWRFSERRSRKSACSNIFTGVNVHQLHQLFQTSGDRDAEHRAKLVWKGMDVDMQQTEEDREAETGLAQALVGLRLCGRTKAGLRAEGPRDHRWHRATSYLQIKEPFSGYTVMDEEVDFALVKNEFPLSTEDKKSANQNNFKSSSWSLGVTRHEGARDSEHYLHRILH